MGRACSKARWLLADPGVPAVVAGHRNRLEHRAGRGGLSRTGAGCSCYTGMRDDDLVRDATEVLTSFGVSLYGRRSVRNRAERALRCTVGDVGPASPRAAR
jgi:putative resolvase